MAIWKEIARDSALNAASGAGVTAAIATKTANTGGHENFNRLLVINDDVVKIRVNLNGDTANGQGIWLLAGLSMSIEPEAGISFTNLTYTNMDGATALTIDKILFRWAKCVRVG